jgi:hypothetical protein
MRTMQSRTVIVPNSQQHQQAHQESTMDGQIGAQDAVPVFHRTAGWGGLVPSTQQWLGCTAPGRRQVGRQLRSGLVQDGAPLPGLR